jgi:pantothenate kinase
MDGFHLANVVLDELGRRNRKGAIDTFDGAGYVAALRRIVTEYGVRDIYVPAFDRHLDEPVAAGHVVPAGSRLVVTEGNYLGLPVGDWAEARPLLHRLYFIACPRPVRRARLVQRHLDGGRTAEAAAAWADTVDEPNAQLVETSKSWCDLVVDGY